jgi:hypothetical protein
MPPLPERPLRAEPAQRQHIPTGKVPGDAGERVPNPPAREQPLPVTRNRACRKAATVTLRT